MIKADNNPKGANTMSKITYSRQGDYLIPDLTLPTEPELPLGRYALMHRDYLEKHKRVTYLNLLTSGRLNGHVFVRHNDGKKWIGKRSEKDRKHLRRHFHICNARPRKAT